MGAMASACAWHGRAFPATAAMPPTSHVFAERARAVVAPVLGSRKRTYSESDCTLTTRPIQPDGAP